MLRVGTPALLTHIHVSRPFVTLQTIFSLFAIFFPNPPPSIPSAGLRLATFSCIMPFAAVPAAPIPPQGGAP